MHITIIGTGNVAICFARAFSKVGHTINEIYSRENHKAQRLIDVIGLEETQPQTHLDFSQSFSQLFVIAASDDSIESIAGEIVLPEDSILVHTSGTVSMSVLERAASADYGVLYPLQTISSASILSGKVIPIILNASTSRAKVEIGKLAESAFENAFFFSDAQREKIHLAAVFCNNFVNHLIGTGFDILKVSGIDKKILYPLIQETINKAISHDPVGIQTGPAKREDYKTIGRHLDLLADDEQLLSCYKALTNSIIFKHNI